MECNGNTSTLSLHIAAYENSIDTTEDDGSRFEKDQLEFPRQQKDQSNHPEIMQFKASQRLLDPNNRSRNAPNYAANMSVPNIPRIGFRPNIYARPQAKPQAPTPRPPVPSSRSRMLKPGFETSTTPYSRPPARRSQEKSPEPPPRKLEPYPILSNFMFTEEQLNNTPSFRIHNIPFEEEIILRRSGTFFIKELCRRLNVPYSVKSSKISPRAMCVAMIYFHRFYMFHSLTTFNPMHLGTACLFLAAKCEECPRKLSHFSKQLYSMLHPEDPNLLEADELEPMNDLITALETAVLRTLAFELNIDLPHVDIIQAPFTTANDRLRKMAYHLTTDLLTTTTLCIQYESKTLAAACFFVAGAYLDINMEKDYGEKWFLLIDKNLTEDVLIKIVKSFTDCLKDCKHIIRAERIRSNDASRGESSKPVSEQLQKFTPEIQSQNTAKEVRPKVRDDRSRERVISHEPRPPPASEGRPRGERAIPKESRLSEPTKNERPRAPYDQSRDRAPENIKKDRPKAPYERRTPEATYSDQTSQQERLRKPSSRTPEAPAYESIKSSHERRTPEVPQSHRLKVPYEKSQERDRRTSEALIQDRNKPTLERRTPEVSHHENPKISQEQFRDRDHGLNQSVEKPMDFSLERHKPQLDKPKRERSKESQTYQDLEAPLLVPPPLPPPSLELRKRKMVAAEEIPQKRPVDTTYHSTSAKQRFEPVDFSLPPPPLPPPQDRRFSLPVRDQSESTAQRNNLSKVSSNSQQQVPHNDYRRDETRHSSHHRSEHHRSSNSNTLVNTTKDTPQQPPQRSAPKREMMQNFVPPQSHSSKSGNRHSHRTPTLDELEEGEIE
uniref:Cyclin-like domain-containing protein n=1 Tax=Panagrolaimus sp. ES5 TaxID=591445 RepID=A0AC34FKQ9_9BILA